MKNDSFQSLKLHMMSNIGISAVISGNDCKKGSRAYFFVYIVPSSSGSISRQGSCCSSKNEWGSLQMSDLFIIKNEEKVSDSAWELQHYQFNS